MSKTNNFEQVEKRNGLNRKIKRKKTGLGFLWKLIFGRTLIIGLMILVQIYLLFVVAAKMGEYSQIGFSLLQVLSIFVVIYIINSNENPAFKMAWIIPVCAFPVFGTLLFLFVQLNPGNYKLKLRLQRRIDETMQYSHTSPNV
ncbi:MAG: PLDc_N domain-containing protein, partial [Lachnospiraceae bacterium]|nr:PLDc_N domain-containing protein [Lachnospiraceae bacterium]